jgi:osmotically-inducible protein OsmY
MTQPDIESGHFGASRKGQEWDAGAIWGRRRGEDGHSSEAVAEAVANALHWDFAVPRNRVVAQCDGGWVTLIGDVERDYQRSAAEADARRVEGVRGVTNAITVGAAAPRIAAPTRGVDH